MLVLLEINHLRMKGPDPADRWLISNRLAQEGGLTWGAEKLDLSNLSQQSSKKVEIADLGYPYAEGPEA